MSRIWTEDQMQKAIKAYREERSQRHAAELYGVPQSGQDKPLRRKGARKRFSKKKKKNLCPNY